MPRLETYCILRKKLKKKQICNGILHYKHYKHYKMIVSRMYEAFKLPSDTNLAEFLLMCRYFVFTKDSNDMETRVIIKGIITRLFDVKKKRVSLKTPPPIKTLNKYQNTGYNKICKKISTEAKTMKLKPEYNEKYLMMGISKLSSFSNTDIGLFKNIIYKIKEYVDDLTLISNMSFTDRLNSASSNTPTPIREEIPEFSWTV